MHTVPKAVSKKHKELHKAISSYGNEPERVEEAKSGNGSEARNSERGEISLNKPAFGSVKMESLERPCNKTTMESKMNYFAGLDTTDYNCKRSSSGAKSSKRCHQANVRVIARIRPPNKLEAVTLPNTILIVIAK